MSDHEAPRWFHGSAAVLAVGDFIVPGSTIGTANWDYGDGGNDTMVWLTRDPIQAALYGAFVYEVEPDEAPIDWVAENGWDDAEHDEWVTNRARVLTPPCTEPPS